MSERVGQAQDQELKDTFEGLRAEGNIRWQAKLTPQNKKTLGHFQL